MTDRALGATPAPFVYCSSAPASCAGAVLPGLVVIVIPLGRHISIIVIAGIVIINTAIVILVNIPARQTRKGVHVMKKDIRRNPGVLPLPFGWLPN